MCNKIFFHLNKKNDHSLQKHNQIDHVNDYTSFAAMKVSNNGKEDCHHDIENLGQRFSLNLHHIIECMSSKLHH